MSILIICWCRICRYPAWHFLQF